jgi:hypothetical protein
MLPAVRSHARIMRSCLSLLRRHILHSRLYFVYHEQPYPFNDKHKSYSPTHFVQA